MRPVSELRPCPFCGGEAHFIEHIAPHNNDLTYDVSCLNERCYLYGGAEWGFDTKEEAIEAWNTQTSATWTTEPPTEDTAWSIRDSILKLIEAANILLNDCNYDGDGYEQIVCARDAALNYVEKGPLKPEPPSEEGNLEEGKYLMTVPVNLEKCAHVDGPSDSCKGCVGLRIDLNQSECIHEQFVCGATFRKAR